MGRDDRDGRWLLSGTEPLYYIDTRSPYVVAENVTRSTARDKLIEHYLFESFSWLFLLDDANCVWLGSCHMTKILIAHEVIEELKEVARRKGGKITPHSFAKMCKEYEIEQDFVKDRFKIEVGVEIFQFSAGPIRRNEDEDLLLRMQLARKLISDHYESNKERYRGDFQYVKDTIFKIRGDKLCYIGSVNTTEGMRHEFFSARRNKIVGLSWTEIHQKVPEFADFLHGS